jgi:hypothetical protein
MPHAVPIRFTSRNLIPSGPEGFALSCLISMGSLWVDHLTNALISAAVVLRALLISKRDTGQAVREHRALEFERSIDVRVSRIRREIENRSAGCRQFEGQVKALPNRLYLLWAASFFMMAMYRSI